MRMCGRSIWLSSRMLTYADVCSRMLTYAHVCSHMLTYAHICSHMLTYAHADVCGRIARFLSLYIYISRPFDTHLSAVYTYTYIYIAAASAAWWDTDPGTGFFGGLVCALV